MVMNRKASIVLLTVSCVLIILGVFYLSEAHGVWIPYKRLLDHRIIPREAYESWLKQMTIARNTYRRLFPIYLTAGLALSISGVLLFIFSLLKLYKLSRLLEVKGLTGSLQRK